MKQYFNINIEFDHAKLYQSINQNIDNKEKMYICVVDANVLTMAQKNTAYRNVINNAMVNTCDGSSIAMMAGWLHHKKFRALNGPTIFSHYIEQPIKQILLGSTVTTSARIKQTLKTKGINADHIDVMPLPFMTIHEFDYPGIAAEINKLAPDIIWVSLGAPKQEFFMNMILPYLNKGVMFGIGAAFNFYVGDIKKPKTQIGSLSLIWLTRWIAEPRKLSKRIFATICTFPGMYWQEKKKVKKEKKLLN